MRRPALLTQILAVNALLVAATVLVAGISVRLDPDALADPRRPALLLAAGLATVLGNGLVLRRRFRPLEELIAAMERVDFGPGPRRGPAPAGEAREVARLREAFERMLGRLDAERSRTASAVLQAQEAERARLARDLHDEANQALTGVLLRLEATTQQGATCAPSCARPRRWPRGPWASSSGWPASCGPRRSTTSGWPSR